MKCTAFVNLALGLLFRGSPAAASPLQARSTVLTHRAETTAVNATGGTYEAFRPGYLAGTWEVFKRGEYVDLAGTGYVRVRWEVEYWKGVGPMYEPTFDGVSGTFLLVAGGGGYQISDAPQGCPMGTGCVNFTGADEYGYSYPWDGYDPWHNMYYYLDGSVTITNHEAGGLYNVGVMAYSYNDILTDINTAPGTSGNLIKYGYSYDPAEGSCPCSA
ncbi:hypothetical protein F4820DRAFT_469701 [Hypoxylon rubiginosum]|uniref:Uncharacterized protein n=1 Tax=Hypoxylon rubiginosum TaxID=110542 RepID=A0ACB9Z1J5_9PEZI|nr:hypothetical protein F4820DRAFT_469701 [Hypoxylon rubiginosum]